MPFSQNGQKNTMEQVLSDENSRLDGETREKPRVLVAPLDWGLGHATRCIPIIHQLLSLGCKVFLAGEGAQQELLKEEFPQLSFLNLPGYRIRYAKSKKGLIWKMIQQGPKMRRAILYEHQWLKKMVKEHKLDAVISDNRYGLYHETIPCVFMTHQLLIKSSAGKWTEKILQKRNYRYIDRFTECWVPDQEKENSFAGELSHPPIRPSVPVHYIGLLSRFNKSKALEEKKDHVLILLSGPEPQRSMLEEKMIREISNYKATAVIVRGLPGSASLIPSTNMIRVYNHLPAADLQKEIETAEWVISRSGYSTVMDMIVMQKKSILIPTPGQTEQEYLGDLLMKKRSAICIPQGRFSLAPALEQAAKFNYELPASFKGNDLKKILADFLSSKFLNLIEHRAL
jgi:predicted glycosyltransferase